jgi:hypothetical protein
VLAPGLLSPASTPPRANRCESGPGTRARRSSLPPFGCGKKRVSRPNRKQARAADPTCLSSISISGNGGATIDDVGSSVAVRKGEGAGRQRTLRATPISSSSGTAMRGIAMRTGCCRQHRRDVRPVLLAPVQSSGRRGAGGARRSRLLDACRRSAACRRRSRSAARPGCSWMTMK